jgi:hypothetical protein
LLLELLDASAEFVVDILDRTDGISVDEATAEGASFDLAGRRVPVIGRAARLKNKRAAGRAQDLADVEALERATR